MSFIDTSMAYSIIICWPYIFHAYFTSYLAGDPLILKQNELHQIELPFMNNWSFPLKCLSIHWWRWLPNSFAINHKHTHILVLQLMSWMLLLHGGSMKWICFMDLVWCYIGMTFYRVLLRHFFLQFHLYIETFTFVFCLLFQAIVSRNQIVDIDYFYQGLETWCPKRGYSDWCHFWQWLWYFSNDQYTW